MSKEPRPLFSIETATHWNDQDYVDILEKNLSWLRELDVHISEAGRYYTYLRILKNRAKQNLSVGLSRPSKANSDAVLNARYETHEIDRLHRRYHELAIVGLRDKLQEVASKGPEYFREEKPGGSSSSARDAMAELMAGSHAARYGLTPAYGNNQFPEPMVCFDDQSIVFECKRLHTGSTRAAARNLREAAIQIDRHIEKGLDFSEGIIYLDITKHVCKNAFSFEGTRELGPVYTQARNRSNSFFNSCVSQFPFHKYKRVAGITIRSSFMLIDIRHPLHVEKYSTFQRNIARESGSRFFEKVASQSNLPVYSNSDSGQYNVKAEAFLMND